MRLPEGCAVLVEEEELRLVIGVWLADAQGITP